jgi:prepilin-type N-terminal cleavage/methylation domain-containing protein
VRLQHNNKNILNSKRGFSLIEILVVLFLVAMLLSLAISNPLSSSQDIEKEVTGLERAIRFIVDESATRNTVTRIHFFLNKDPQEYNAEYGPSGQFVLPSKTEFETSVIGKEEEEKKAKKEKELNQKFSRLTEFQDSNKEISSNVKIIAVGNISANQLQTGGEYSLYSFPSGEKDETMLIMVSDESMAVITTNAFNAKIEHKYIHLDPNTEKDNADKQQKMAKDLFDQWKKEKKD